MPDLIPNAEQTFLDANGDPLVGGKVYYYAPGTTSPVPTWTDFNQSTINTNPVILNGAGRASVWGNGQFREVVYDQFGTLQWDKVTSTQASSATPPTSGNLIVTGYGQINEGLAVSGVYPGSSDALIVNGSESISGNTSIGGSLDVSGGATLGSLDVSGNAVFNSLGTFYAGINVAALSTFNNGISVTGVVPNNTAWNATFYGACYMEDGSEVAGSLNITNGLSIGGNLSVGGSFSANALTVNSLLVNVNASIAQQLLVNGAATLNDGLTVGNYLNVVCDINPDQDGVRNIGGNLPFNAVAAYLFDTVSRQDLKENIGELPPDALSIVMSIPAKQFNYRAVPDRLRWGFMFEDVLRNVPGGVGCGNGSLSYNDLLCLLWKAVQELASLRSSEGGPQ